MGSFYVLGIVNYFEAKSTNLLDQAKWKHYLNEKLDLEQYNTNFTDLSAMGVLKEGVFKKNIEGFYNKLVEITNDDTISIYFNDFGTDIKDYQNRNTMMTFKYHDTQITISANMVILFIQGKVLVEEFSFEPKIINWLFRHIDSSNPLTGCVMTDVLS